MTAKERLATIAFTLSMIAIGYVGATLLNAELNAKPSLNHYFYITRRVPEPYPVIEFVARPVQVETIVLVPEEIKVYPEATRQEIVDAYEHISYGVKSHRFFAYNLWAQTPVTGDTAYNVERVRTYIVIKELLDRVYLWQFPDLEQLYGGEWLPIPNP